MVAGVVSARVRSARQRELLLLSGELAVVGFSAGVATLAAAAVGGTPASEVQAQVLAWTVALLAGVAWRAERRTDIGSVARSMDRFFELSGAWLTAFECESKDSASPVARLLAREIAPAVSVRRFAAGAARSSALLLAAPFVSLALWTLAAEARDATAVGSVLPSPAIDGGAVRSEAARLASAPGLPAPLVEKLRALAAEASALRSTPESERPAVERELASRLEALRREAESSGMTRAGREGTMEGPDARLEPPPAGSMVQTTPPDTASVPGSVPSSPANEVPAGAEKGVLSPRWWPARYDPIVERWLQSERAAADGRPR
jgi:hypothetical protein